MKIPGALFSRAKFKRSAAGRSEQEIKAVTVAGILTPCKDGSITAQTLANMDSSLRMFPSHGKYVRGREKGI